MSNYQEYQVQIHSDRIEWRQNGQLHRTDGPAIEYMDGSRSWFQNHLLHRTDGPAYDGADGTQEWFQNGQRHRLDGPAIEWPDGRQEYWIDGEIYSNDAFLSKTRPKELSVADIEQLLGYPVKIIKD